MKKKSKVSIALLTGAITLFAAGMTACKEKEVFTLPTDTTINAGIEYIPDFQLEKNVTARLDGLKTPPSSKTKAEGLRFTPDVLGTYEYTVTFTKGESVWHKTIAFNVVDTLAPTIVTKIADKTTEIGFYTDLIRDTESVVAKDNCATTLFAKPLSITFGGEKTFLAEGEDTVFLPVAGEYTVEYSVYDFSGNEVRESYTITASDTVAPVIDAPKAMVAWAEGSKTPIPAVNVVDVGRTSCAVTAKNAAGESVAVENGYLMTNEAGRYALSYVATDGAGNASAAFEMTFIVNDKPLISAFGAEGEEEIWSDISRREDGKLKIMTSNEEVTLTFADHFNMKNWAGYNRFYLALENERGERATVQTEIKIGGEWVRVANDEIAPASFTVSGVTPSAKACGFWLSDYGVENVEGVRVTIASAGGVQIAVDEIGLENAEKPTVPTGATGLVAGEMKLAAGQVIVRPVEGTSFGENNALSYKIWASAACQVTVGLTIGGENTYATSNLKEGWNELFRLPALEYGGAEILSQELTAISVQNKSAYGVSLYFDEFAITDKTSAQLSELISGVEDGGVLFGESYSIAWPFAYDERYIADVSVTLVGENGLVKSGLSIGEGVQVGEDIVSGDYTLQYDFTDPFGETKRVEMGICLQKNVLSITLADEALYRSTTSLPEATLSSEVYSAGELESAVVEKYYRRRGQSVWQEGSAGASFAKNGWYEFRYIATVDGVRRELTFDKYVHESVNVIDFEEESAAGKTCLTAGEYADARFLYDGGYYDYRDNMTGNRFEITKDWSKSGDSAISSLATATGWQGVLINGISAKNVSPKGINAVSFWLKADAGCTTQIQLGGGKTSNENGTGASKGWYPSEEFEIFAGEHYYTVFFTRTLTDEVCSLTILAPGRIGFAFDDIEFKHLERLNMEEVAYENYYDMASPLTLEKPAITSDVYAQAQLANAKYELSYTIDGGEPISVREGADGKFAIAFAQKGKISLTWTVSVEGADGVAGVTATQTTEFFAGILELHTEIPTYVEAGGTVAFNAPTCQFELSRYEVNYRKAGEENWTPLTEADGNYEFTPTAEGYYQIQIVGYADVNGVELSGETVHTLYAKGENMLLCFEEEDFLQGGIWYPDSYNSKWHFANLMEKEDGTKWVQFKTTMEAASDGFYWNTPLDLGYDTSRLKLDIYSLTNISALKFEIKVNGVGGWPAKEVAVAVGEQTLVIDFGVNIRRLKALTIEVKAGQEFYVDNVAVVSPVEVTTTTPTTTDGNGAVVEFDPPTSPNAIKNLVVEYQKSGEETWTALEEREGKYSFVTEEGITSYSVRYTMTCTVDGMDIPYEQVDVVSMRDPTVLIDFEGEDPLLGGVSYDRTSFATATRNGSTWGKMTYLTNGWAGIAWENGLDLGETNVKKLTMKVYSPKAYTGLLVEFKTATAYGGKWPEIAVDIPEGESVLTLDFSGQQYELNGMRALIFRTAANVFTTLWIDDVKIVVE